MARSGAGGPPKSTSGLPLSELHLVDTSAWSKARNEPSLAESFEAAVRSGFVATCDIIALELLRSARNADRYRHQTDLLGLLPSCPTGGAQIQRARQVQTELVARGTHRGVKPIDLVIAAAAEAADLPVLHYDHDYDLIADVTGQATRWLAPRGDLP
jgi:predicted nucleic acid-binding protein